MIHWRIYAALGEDDLMAQSLFWVSLTVTAVNFRNPNVSIIVHADVVRSRAITALENSQNHFHWSLVINYMDVYGFHIESIAPYEDLYARCSYLAHD